MERRGLGPKTRGIGVVCWIVFLFGGGLTGACGGGGVLGRLMNCATLIPDWFNASSYSRIWVRKAGLSTAQMSGQLLGSEVVRRCLNRGPKGTNRSRGLSCCLVRPEMMILVAWDTISAFWWPD